MPVTVRGVGVERERGGVTAATFTLSEAPTPGWIAFFRERARHSVFNPLATGLLWVEVAVATFEHNRVRIDLPRMEDLEEMIRSVERFIEGANLDVEFHRGSSG